MNDAALDGLIEAEKAMIGALDAGDIEAVEAAVSLLVAAVERMRASGPPSPANRPDPALLDRIKHAVELAEAARVRIRFLADQNQQRIDLLATASGRFDATPATYSRR